MTLFADVEINQIRILSRAAGALLRYETRTTITLYWVNQGPVIFRTIIKKDKSDNFNLLMESLPQSVPLKNRLNSDEIDDSQLKRISKRVI